MLVPVLEVLKDNLYRVYVDGIFVAVVVPVVLDCSWHCIDIRSGDIFVGSTRYAAVDRYFKSKFKECLCDEG